METYLGINLGGTNLLIGEIDSLGNILKFKRYTSSCFNQKSAIDMLKASLDDYIKTEGWVEGKPVAMGVGLIGRVDSENGVWLQIDPSRTQTFELAKDLSECYGMPCHIDNDVKSATRAEIAWGFGRVSKDFIYINIGTGIAAGIVVGGKLVRGSHFNAGEVGHVRTGVSVGVRCTCSRTDCVEAIASGIGFDKCARILKDRYATKLEIPKEEEGRVQVQEVFRLCNEGDPLCTVLVENATTALASLIMNLVRMSDPETIILGGSIMGDGFLYEHILKKLNPLTMRFVTNGIVMTKLNPVFANLLGAGAVAMNL